MEYTLIGGPLLGDNGQYYAEVTINKLLKDPRNGWTLEILGFSEEHFCTPYYDDGEFLPFDDVIIQPITQLSLFDEKYTRWGSLIVAYEEESNVLNWHKWMRDTKAVTFVFRRRERELVTKTWVFYDVTPRHIEYDSIGDGDVSLEFHFGRFEAVYNHPF